MPKMKMKPYLPDHTVSDISISAVPLGYSQRELFSLLSMKHSKG